MKAYLLDANVLIALAWPSHALHARVIRWFERKVEAGWATCPFTEAAFVRILSNPGFSSSALTAEKAAELLARNVAHPTHQFWPLDLTVNEAIRISRVRPTGHRQINDIYLLALAIHKRGQLATCDEGIPAWGGLGRGDRYFIELIRE
jgi:toxin-antitoxin system PIN domain toxin